MSRHNVIWTVFCRLKNSEIIKPILTVFMLYTPKALFFTRSVLVGLFLVALHPAFAQRPLNLGEHDSKPYYFGITLSTNLSRFQSDLHERFLNQDSILVAEPMNGGGFSLGLLGTLKLTHRFEARFNPQLAFLDRGIHYKLKYADFDQNTVKDQKVESVLVNLPIQLKFNSDRIGNFRVYLLGGGKIDYDLASNARVRKADDILKLDKADYGLEGGIGFNFYFPSFIFSPEIKISNGIRNIHARNAGLQYSNVIDKINSRMIMFSIHLEG